MVDAENTSSAQLASLGSALHSAIADSKTKLDEISKELIRRKEGEVIGEGGERVLVIFPANTIKPDKAAVDKARDLLGELFGKLFERVVIYKPRKDFRARAAALLTPARHEKVISAVEVQSSAYVRYSL